MSIYAVGDIQGCYNALSRGLEKVRFDPSRDQLWCVGDLVNRGGQSALTLELLFSIRSSLKVVLGNHDLYLLKAMYGSNKKNTNKEIRQVVAHKDAPQWCSWLRQQPLYHYDAARNTLLVHAGLPHIWTLEECIAYGDEASQTISMLDNNVFWDNLFGNKPKRLKPKHRGIPRLRAILNYFTRMRFINASGKLNLYRTDRPSQKLGSVDEENTELPWYAFPRKTQPDLRILFGHWASLQGELRGKSYINAIALDTGCVWGGKLSLYNIETGELFTSKQTTKKHK